jgi:hypothetical protein
MTEFLPHYIEYDLDKPESYRYTFTALFGAIRIPIWWTEITYSDMAEENLDIKHIRIYFGNDHFEQRLFLKFPMLKEYKIHAYQHIDMGVFQFQEGYVTYEFKDFVFNVLCELRTTNKGYLRPIVY